MALNIRNPRAHELAAELAQITGESLTDAVISALEQRLAGARRAPEARSRYAKMLEISARCARLPRLDRGGSQ